MGCKFSALWQKRPRGPRKSTTTFSVQEFKLTEIQYFDEFFHSIHTKSTIISHKLKLLQFEKSLLYHSLGLTRLFKDPDSSTACSALVLFLVASGNKIEFIDACPYLEVSNETEIYFSFKRYVELLHLNIVALTELKPLLQDYIEKAREIIRTLSHTADAEGFDLSHKLNLIAIMVYNCKILWQIPSFIDNRLLCVKKDLLDVKNGIKFCVSMSCKFSLFHGLYANVSPSDTIRSIWYFPEELI
jgi:hypothetical protein